MNFTETMRDLLRTATEELLRDYGIPTTVADAPLAADGSLSGILGFTGRDMCGCVVITSTPDTFSATNPTQHIPAASWCGELTNQIVGKFKAGLYMRGVDVAISIPVVLSATRLSPQVEQVPPVHLALPTGTLSIWLEYQGEPVLQQVAPESAALLDVVMF